MGPLIFLLITCAAVPLGAQFLSLTRLAPRTTPVPERFLMSATIGYVLIGYGTLILGLLGHLTQWSAAVLLAVAAVAGLGHWDLLWEALLRCLNMILRGFRSRGQRLGALFLLLILALTLVTALEPPSGRDFDGLAEHLAQASHYARHGSVEPLWYDHHSQFPSNMQMLYTLSLLYDSTSAAKLFHWFHGIMALLAAALIARRFMSRSATVWAAVVLASMPLFLMLAGVSYVDLGVMAYGLIALFAFLRWYRRRLAVDLLLAGLMAGCAATVKVQGLTIWGILMAGALVVIVGEWRARAEKSGPVAPPTSPAPSTPQGPPTKATSIGTLIAAAAVGMLICLPWFVRSYVNTGNPVYPFAYSIFGGKHWSADRALGYQRHQLEFGMGELPPQAEIDALPRWKRLFVGPREPWKWLYAPFGLTFQPWEYEVFLGKLPNILMTSIGPLWLAFLVVLLVMPNKPPAVRISLWLFLPLWLWWFASMQLARYLVPSLALLAPATGYAIYRGLSAGRIARQGTIWAVGLWCIMALSIAWLLAKPALPVVFGLQSREQYLSQSLDIYPVSAYIAERLPQDARVATYGEVRCFYFDRDCFWAEHGHSDLIDYAKMREPSDLVKRYGELGITHVLLNQQHLPGLWDSPETTVRLLREGIDQGLLVQLGDLGRNFMLFEVRQPDSRRAALLLEGPDIIRPGGAARLMRTRTAVPSRAA
ncbi:MAG: ArnT family glycosyltransferase [Armatimonadota bacterium]